MARRIDEEKIAAAGAEDGLPLRSQKVPLTPTLKHFPHPGFVSLIGLSILGKTLVGIYGSIKGEDCIG